MNNDKTVSGRDDASVAILNIFNFVKTDKDSAAALSFITEVSTRRNQSEQYGNL